MIRFLKRFVAVLAVCGAAGAVWYFRPAVIELAARFSIAGPMSHKVLYYCPMHPAYTSDKPGDCPICNMKLVKKENEEISSPSALPVPPQWRDGSADSRADGKREKVRGAKDICYLHNCPMMHDGKPCPMLVVAKEGEKVICPICGSRVAETENAAKTKKILYWTDPMIPGYKSGRPGKSPMGMEMIPVYEEEAGFAMKGSAPEGYAPILLTPQKQQLIGVRTEPVKKIKMTKTIRTVGRIAYDPELYQAEEEFIQAAESLRQAETGTLPEIKDQAARLVDSARIKLKLMGLGEDLVKEIETAGKPDRSLLYSDAGGKAWLYAPIYEYEIPLVKVGDEVKVEVPAVSGKDFRGKIRSIDPVLDPMTRSVRVRAILENPEGVLKPEMYVNATLEIDLGDVLAVPEESIFKTGERNLVFVAKPDGIFEPREVGVGAKTDGYSEIKSGVAEGEQVVTGGNFLIDSESRLKAALKGLGGGTHPHGS